MQADRERAKAYGKARRRPKKKLDERKIQGLFELGLSARSIGKIMARTTRSSRDSGRWG